MSLRPLLLIPGPTPCPPEALRAAGRPMIPHRGPEYEALQAKVCAGLREAFQTANPVLVFPASGTGGLEAAIANVLSPGDAVLGVSVGAFGDRFCEIAEAFGTRVTRMSKPWGEAASPEEVAAAARRLPDLRAVLLTHNETSTGVLNDVRGIAAAVREVRPEALLLVDSISGLLTANLPADAWDLDIVIGGSQKAWMTPAGLTFVSVSERAMAAHRQARLPRYYFDFTRMLRLMERNQTPYTPAVSLLFALRESLRLIRREGVAASVRRHARLAAATRAGLQALKLDLPADREHYSNSVTAARAPEGVDVGDLRARLRQAYGVQIAGGQGAWRADVFRIGHLGYLTEGDILAGLGALERALADLGYKPAKAGAPVAAAQAVFRASEGEPR